jgi:hypothetical protein
MAEETSNRPTSGSTGSSTIVDRVRDQATSQLNTQKNRATDGLGTAVQAVRASTERLRQEHHDSIARYVEQAADQIERLSTRLRNKDVGELMSDAQRLARRQPALFVGGAFAAGLLGARFLKSSSPRESYERTGERNWRDIASSETPAVTRSTANPYGSVPPAAGTVSQTTGRTATTRGRPARRCRAHRSPDSSAY